MGYIKHTKQTRAKENSLKSSSTYKHKGNSVMTYKSYKGTVEYSEADECLFGKIVGINDIISYEATSVIELKKAFQEAVDDYLLFCKKTKRKPNKPYSGNIMLRIDPELHAAISIGAQEVGLSLNQYAAQILAHAQAFKQTG